jgi:predicted DNA-binding protein (MmcQ/YjbR family)
MSANAKSKLSKPGLELRDYALSFPDTVEAWPWDERVIKVNKKVFVFINVSEEKFNIGVKLPFSNGAALMMPFAEPSAYNLGKSGWVTCRFQPNEELPLDLLKSWIAESYRAIAPQKLIKQLDQSSGAGPAPVFPPPSAKAAKRSRSKSATKSKSKSKSKRG